MLRLDGITKIFPGVKALNDVSFDVKCGEVHALVGENGAGKSTLMHIVGGIFPPTSGTIFLNGEKIHFHNAHDAHLKGIKVVYQELSIVPNLSVAENIYANSQPVNGFGLIKRRELNRRAAEMIKLFDEKIDPDTPAGELTIGKRQVVEILKALTLNPRIILLDEPTSSLSGTETEALFRNIRKLKEKNISFMFISHHLPEIFEIADRVTVLRDGVYQGTYNVADVTEDDLISCMVGRSVCDMFGCRKMYEGPQNTVLEVNGLYQHNVYEDISFTVNAGEIVGFAGLVGAGRTEIARSIFGLEKPDRGKIRLNGSDISIRSVQDAIAHGIGYLSEDRKLQGLFLGLSVKANLVSPSLKRFTSGAGLVNDCGIYEFAENMVDNYNIVTPSIDQTVYNLSGGNQQKVLLGMWMGTEPTLLIVDEPTKGVDVGAKEEIYNHIFRHAEKGAAVLLISSDLNEILGMSDRICVVRGGRIQKILSSKEATEELIISYALGAGEAVA
ncbi:MAG: sugar ABC transporter ATP-binding protein [Candidatus Latescibacteria bacterium]|nr:sugar ABC transporter ATP-binding protein [Candidatus Latescibacterota bacterium]